jgi:AbrB family looped-hinge helix DNA binding protein
MANFMKLTKKNQLLIPKAIRDKFDLKPGTQFDVVQHDHVIVLVPLGPMNNVRGVFKGIDTTIDRSDI